MVTRVSKIRKAGPWSGHLEYDPNTSSGLTFGYTKGWCTLDGNVIDFPAGTVTLPSGDFVIYVDLDSNAIIVTALADLPVDNVVQLYNGTTNGSEITTLVEDRSWTMAGIPGANLWDEAVTVDDPDVWYKFNEASGNILNQGSYVGLDLPTTEGTTSEYGLVGPTPAVSDPHAVALRQGNSLRTVAGTGLQDLNASSPSGTGTFFAVFRVEQITEESDRLVFSASNGTFDDHKIELFVRDNTALQFILSNGSASANDYLMSVSIAQMEAISTPVTDGNWHFVAVVQDGVAPDIYYDGELVASPTINDGASITGAYWVDDLNSGAADRLDIGTSATNIGGQTVNSLQGYIDEFCYFDGVEISASRIAQLWGFISGRVGFRGAKEGLLYAIWDEIGQANPDHLLHLQWENNNTDDDHGSATTTFGGSSEPGTGPTYHTAGWDSTSRAMTFNPGSYLNGHILRWPTASADFYSDTSGWIMWMHRHVADNTWNQIHFHMGNTTATFDDGEFKVSMQTQGGSTDSRITMEFRNTSPNSKAVFYQAHLDGALDTLDGNWHQYILYQPNDGGGPHFWADGVAKHDSSLFAIGTGTGYDDDVWFADLSADLTGTRTISFGGQEVGVNELNGIDGQLGFWVYHGGAMTDDFATRLWEATGL